MTIDPKKLKEILVSQNYIKKEDMDKAEAGAVQNQQGLETYLLSKDLLPRTF